MTAPKIRTASTRRASVGSDTETEWRSGIRHTRPKNLASADSLKVNKTKKHNQFLLYNGPHENYATPSPQYDVEETIRGDARNVAFSLLRRLVKVAESLALTADEASALEKAAPVMITAMRRRDANYLAPLVTTIVEAPFEKLNDVSRAVSIALDPDVSKLELGKRGPPANPVATEARLREQFRSTLELIVAAKSDAEILPFAKALVRAHDELRKRDANVEDLGGQKELRNCRRVLKAKYRTPRP